jgi:asparagine synthase (glutamine-hydrolysing)
MSAIYGYINLDGRPVAPEILQKMKQAMAFCGPDGSSLWLEGNCGLGQLLLFNTPEAENEKYPLIDISGNIIFMAACRIDNRAELFSLLDIPNEERISITDGELMFRAYLKWGEDACDRLLGDWSFVAFHKKENKLILARDHCGITALYYYQAADFLAFASSLKGLLTLSEIPRRLNEFRLAQILVAWPGDGEQTCYEGINNIKPGAYLKIENKTLIKRQYWELTEQKDLILQNEEDYYARFREIFSEAVKCRIRSKKNIGISLSGGLDSTSVAAFAAIELAKQNRELYAFTSVPLYTDYKIPKNRNGNEGELAGLMAKMYPNIRHFLVNAEGYSPLEAIRKSVEIFDEPMHAASNQYWIQAIMEETKKYNISTLLSGQIGNGVISWPIHKVQLVRDHSLKYYRHSASLLYRKVKDYRLNKKYKYPFLRYSDIEPEFANKLDLINRMKILNHDPTFKKVLPFKKAQINIIINFFQGTYCQDFNNNLKFNISNLDPCGDKRLIEFSLAIPKKLYAQNRFEKILIKNGIKDKLPKSIIDSKCKGLQAADIETRIWNEIGDIKKLISQAFDHKFILEILNLNGINPMPIFNRVPSSIQKFNYSKLLRSLSTLIFLFKFKNKEYAQV